MWSPVAEDVLAARGDVSLRRLREGDVSFVAERMRGEDRREVWASHHMTPLQALDVSVRTSSMLYVVALRECPVVVFGCAPVSLLSDRKGIPWLLATEEFLRVRVPFLRYGGRVVGLMRRRFEILENWVDARNVVSLSWCERVGFEVHPARPYGAEGLPFCRIEMRRNRGVGVSDVHGA
jgi:hypothetical protein